MNYKELIERYIAAWNETDPARRLELLRRDEQYLARERLPFGRRRLRPCQPYRSVGYGRGGWARQYDA